MRDRLRQVPDCLIAFIEQPFRNIRHFRRELAQQPGWDYLARLSSGEKINCPRRICRLGALEVALQRGELARRCSRCIQLIVKACKFTHGSL